MAKTFSTEIRSPILEKAVSTSHSSRLTRSLSCPLLSTAPLDLPTRESRDDSVTTPTQKRTRRKRMIIPTDSDLDDDEFLKLAQVLNEKSDQKSQSFDEKDETIGNDRPQRKIADRLGDSFHSRAARAERKQTAIVNKLVREAKKVAKKKKKVEFR